MPIPRNDSELMIWLNNFATAFAAHATALGFTAADVSSVNADAAMHGFLVGDLLPTYKSAVRARSTYKNLIVLGPLGRPGGSPPPVPTTAAAPALVPPGILPRLRLLVQRIQLAPGYTEAVGRDLGILGTEPGGSEPSDASAKPTAKARGIASNTVQIDFSKERFDGVLIEGRRTGETEWTTLATDNFSPYVDARPLKEDGKPEVREYRLRYIEFDEPLGEWSDVISATARP
jgi:hypothetical protein